MRLSSKWKFHSRSEATSLDLVTSPSKGSELAKSFATISGGTGEADILGGGLGFVVHNGGNISSVEMFATEISKNISKNNMRKHLTGSESTFNR